MIIIFETSLVCGSICHKKEWRTIRQTTAMNYFDVWYLELDYCTRSSLGLHVRKYALTWSLKSYTWYYVVNLDFTFTCIQVWAGPLSGNRLAVAFWNRCSKVATITASWEALGLESGIRVSVRDLWQVSYPTFAWNFLCQSLCFLFI